MKYDFKLEMAVENNSHTQLLKRIPQAAEVLELGCATGYMSQVMSDQLQCRVVGVELDAQAAEQASRHCVQVIRADVERLEWLQQLDNARFDVITCADIIEHLREPQKLLSALRDYLKPEGVLLASIPNAAHASIRLELLEGRLTYEETGLLDRTHLHLYTQDSVRALVSQAGYTLEELSYTFHDLADDVIRARLARLGLQATERALAVLHAPDAAAFQFIVVAHPHRVGEQVASFRELTDKPLRDSMEVYRNLLDGLHEARSSAQTRGNMIEERDAALAEQHAEILERDTRIADYHTRIADYHKTVSALRGEIERLQKQHSDKLQQAGEEIRRGHEARQRLQAELVRIGAESAQLQSSMHQVQQQNRLLSEDLARHGESLRGILNSRGWRTWMLLSLPARAWRGAKPLREFVRQHPGQVPKLTREVAKRGLAGGAPALRHLLWELNAQPPRATDPGYAKWIARHEQVDASARQAMQTCIDGVENPPLISVIMPVYNVDPHWLRQALDSLLAQSWPHWEACVVDDASTQPDIARVLKEYKRRDSRIRIHLREHNGHIAAASNSALAMAGGDYVALMDHDDLLAEHALYYVAREIMAHPEAGLIYSDEDKIGPDRTRFAHYFKPDYNPDLMLSHNMICHLGVYRRRLVNELGGFREGYDGAQDYDLALRVLSRLSPGQVRHIPRILYHWRVLEHSTASGADAKPYAMDAAIRAVSQHLEAEGIQARVIESPLIEGMLRVEYALPEPPPRVSIIIPTHNGLELLSRCIESILDNTRYAPFEIIVVDNDSDDQATLDYLEQHEKTGAVRVLRYPKPFNFSAINNFAVTHSKGEVLALLNNDMEVISPNWLSEMVSQALRPEIGAVGARLWYPDGRLQHGGVVLGLGGVAGHAMKYMPREHKGYNARAVLVQNYSALTAACLVIRRQVFDQVDGFDAVNLPVAFNDVDFCLRIQEQGYRNLWTPYAELYHHESASRGLEDTPEKQARFRGEIDYMKARWGELLQQDPAYNPNLTHSREDFSLSD